MVRRSLHVTDVASWTVLGLFCITVSISSFLPIYTDEIAVKIATGRLLNDGFELISLFPQCGAAFSLPVPFTWIPARFLDWMIYGNLSEPIFLRLIGIMVLVAWLGALGWFAKSHLKTEISLLRIMGGLVAFVSLGVLPFLLVLNRPEQSLLIGITYFCLLPFILARYQFKSNWVWALLTLSFLLVASYIFSSHPKTFFFLPLIIVSALHFGFSSRRIVLGISLFAGLAWISYDSLTFWSNRIYCSDAPLVNGIFKSISLSFESLFTQPGQFLLGGLDNVIHSKEYIKNLLFQQRYQSDWLPSNSDQKLGGAVASINYAMKAIFVLGFGYVIVALTNRVRADFHDRKLVPQTIIPAALLIGVFFYTFFLAGKNFYESSLVLPLALLLIVLLFPLSGPSTFLNRSYSFIFGILLITSIVSQINLIRSFTAYIPYPWITGGQVSGQDLSISPFKFSKKRDEMIDAAALCGIRANHYNPHLVIDDLTYFTFKNAYKPFHVLYVASFWGQDIGDKNFFSFLRQKKSVGVITSCNRLPPEIRTLAKEHADFCCFSQQDINMLGKKYQTQEQ